MRGFLTKFYAVALKEYKHILRDPFTLSVALVMPMIFVFFFGFIIDLDYKHIKILARDNDQSAESRRFLETVGAGGYFDLTPVHSPLEADNFLYKNKFPGLMIIQKNFGKNARGGDVNNPARVQLMLDGTDNARAGIILNYMTGISQSAGQIFGYSPPFNQNIVRTRFLFNPELNSRWFIVPALATIIIGLLSILLTALTVAKEWENGSMELLLSTPVHPFEIILGKIAPYFALCFFNILLIFVLAVLVFKIPFAGSFILYMSAAFIYITGALALGILISVLTRSQAAAIQFAFAVGMLPGFVFAGFIFPVENMPLFFRGFTYIFPQRWFLFISRTLFLSDASLYALAVPFLCITAFTCVMVFLSVKKFKKDVEP